MSNKQKGISTYIGLFHYHISLIKTYYWSNAWVKCAGSMKYDTVCLLYRYIQAFDFMSLLFCVSLFMYTTITSDGYTVGKLSYYHLYCVMVYFINQAHYLHVLLVWHNMIVNLWVDVVEMVYTEYFDIRKLWGP